MNSQKVTLAIVILLAIGGVLYERNESLKVQAALSSLGKDRDALEQQVESLSHVMQQVSERAAKAAAAPQVMVPLPAPAAVRAEEPPVPGVTTKAPAGWSKNGSKPGSYVVGVDQNQALGGVPSAYVKSLDPSVDGFGGMMQTIAPDDYAGKRVQLSGWIKTEDANEGGGHLWLRVDGQQAGAPLQFDNMNNRAPKGTTDWQQYSVVLDVPPDATALAYGFFIQGAGKMWVNGTTINTVGPEVPTTNMMNNQSRKLPKAPVNLGFGP
jgi:hypothetical protein